MRVAVHIRTDGRPYGCEQNSKVRSSGWTVANIWVAAACTDPNRRTQNTHPGSVCVFCVRLSQTDCRLLVHNDPPAGRVLSQTSPVHTVIFSRCLLILSCHMRFSARSGLFPAGFKGSVYCAVLYTVLFCILCCSVPRDVAQPSVYSPYFLSAL
jgi:hypothetical protein